MKRSPGSCSSRLFRLNSETIGCASPPLDVDLHVVLQPFDVADPIQRDLLQAVFRLHDEAPAGIFCVRFLRADRGRQFTRSCGCLFARIGRGGSGWRFARAGLLRTAFQLEPGQRLVRRREKIVVTDRFEQVVHGLHPETFDRILAEGRREDDTGLLGQHPRKLHAVQSRHLDVAEQQIHRMLAKGRKGRRTASVGAR